MSASATFIFFRAPDERSALQVLTALLQLGGELKQGGLQMLPTFGNALLGSARADLATLVVAFGGIGVVRTLSKTCTFDQLSGLGQWVIAELMLISVVLFGVHSGSGFAYFKF